jgi:hypothetical protein
VPDRVAGVRLDPNSPVTFCYTSLSVLERGWRVTVACADGTREGVVAIAPELIIAAPPLDDAPRITGVVAREDIHEEFTIGKEVVFLPATEGAVGPSNLQEALRLAALPLPDAPPERR